MSFFSFVAKNPALAPLFVIAGTGCVGAVSFPAWMLMKHPDITVNRSNGHPWEKVKQDQNTKLLNMHKEFFDNRRNMERPKF
ncbi:hypothetical protein INT43_001284 [Umbelopsis isabellina]|uniref:Uncharacterized protein n=1 Tax=Mortierella isabellina TaxID=91625 RepID=A0A8H7PKC8_MORIS|nr:hypothetical protein INT43_001284 [Umbelopsis isabellina]